MSIVIIKPSLEHLGDVVRVEAAAWPDIGEGMVAEKDKFRIRIENGLMYLLLFNEKPAGIISYQHAAFTDPETITMGFQKTGMRQQTTAT